MDPQFWLRRWERNEIGFHQPEGNPLLRRFWGSLGLERDTPVLVPLSGKTPDMAWLAAQGHPVTGVELSEVAARDFFAERKVHPQRDTAGGMVRYRQAGVQILVGDFFALDPAILADTEAVYDRAALIALPETLRRRYAELLCHSLPPGARVLLVTLEYDPEEMEGPPFPVPQGEVERLLGPRFRVDPLHRCDALADNEHLRKRGLTALTEAVYRLTARDP